MSLDALMAIPNLINKIGDVKLRSQLLDALGSTIEVAGQNRELTEENAELKRLLLLEQSLSFENNFYWRECGPDGEVDGPYCSACWDGEQRLIRLHRYNGRFFGCPVCGVVRTKDGEPVMHGTSEKFRRSSRDAIRPAGARRLGADQ